MLRVVVFIRSAGHILIRTALILSFSLGFPINANVSANQNPTILDSGVELKDSRPNETTYYFSLQVGREPLSQLIIDLPMGVDIQRWVDVVDDNNRPVDSSYERIGQKAIVKFAKSIAIGSKLNFYIHGIKARGTLNLPISVKLEGNPENRSIGTLRIN